LSSSLATLQLRRTIRSASISYKTKNIGNLRHKERKREREKERKRERGKDKF
jgi:hypothetical protein